MPSNFLSSILTAQNSIRMAGDNLSSANTRGGRRSDQDFRSLTIGGGNVEVLGSSTIDSPGSTKYTGRDGDLSVANSGNGMYGFLPVSPNAKSTEKLLSVTGSFDLDKNGILTDESTGKILLGAPAKEGADPDFSTLGPILIDRNTVLEAVATSQINAKMYINSEEIVTGDAQATLSSAGDRDDLIDPKGIKSGSKFRVAVTKKAGPGESQADAIDYTFGGFLQSAAFDPLGSDFAAVAGEKLEIKIGGSSVISISGIAGANNKDFLESAVEQINANPALQARISEQEVGVDKKISLIIAPKSDIKNGISVDSTAKLASALRFDNPSIPAADPSEQRFATMQQLYNALKSNGAAFSNADISGSGAKDTVVFLKTVVTSSVSMTNTSGSKDQDILGMLGMKKTGILQPSYNPLVSGVGSMAKGFVKPDSTTTISVYDMQGNKRAVYMSVKKVGEGIWGAELYYPQDGQSGASANVIAQAGLLRFDGAGKLKDILPIDIPLLSKPVGDLNADLGSAVGAVVNEDLTISVDGVKATFKYKDATPDSPQIVSAYDLISQINTSDVPVTVKIVKDGGNNKLEFAPKEPGKAVTITGALAVKMDINPGATEVIPLLGKSDPTFTWSTDPGGVSPSTIKINIDPVSVLQQRQDYNMNLQIKDGNAAGSFLSWFFDETGNIGATYSNGATKLLYKVPVASVIVPNDLINKGNDMYAPSIKSGDVQYYEAGKGSAPALRVKMLEQSNIQTVKEMMQIIDTGQWNAMLTAGWGVDNKAKDDITSTARR